MKNIAEVKYVRLNGQKRIYKNAELIEQLVTHSGNKLWVIKTEDGEYKRLRVDQTSFIK